IVEDDGVETAHAFEIEAQLNGRRACFVVPAAQFSGLGWVLEHLGPEAVVSPGSSLKDPARAAVPVLSGSVPTQRGFTHTRWATHAGERVYLHAGGAIGKGGAVAGVQVELPQPLAKYALPAPPDDEAELRRAVLASLRLLPVVPRQVAWPTFGAVWRA